MIIDDKNEYFQNGFVYVGSFIYAPTGETPYLDYIVSTTVSDTYAISVTVSDTYDITVMSRGVVIQ